ncbi:MAG: CDP-diacylglycerol--glycerol-3-phosphate 3-phosphatidyltransferase [Phycisphaerales bacterium]|nr:CDP-diacylglycerol--glycerol-3-phosphate 3-phosphatidyltransferase [Phycisphaerales bacterium]
MSDAAHPSWRPSSWQRRLPNLLTTARIVLAGAFFVVLAMSRPALFDEDVPLGERLGLGWKVNGGLIGAAVVFVLAALTDFLDGILARRWGVVSKFGRVMDPFADKLLVLGAFIMLAGPGFTWTFTDGSTMSFTRVAPWMAVVILARELLVTSLRGVLESQGVDFSATMTGKLKMVLQSVAVPVILVVVSFATPWPGTWAAWLLDGLVWATVAVSVLSGVPYVQRAVAAFRAEGMRG